MEVVAAVVVEAAAVIAGLVAVDNGEPATEDEEGTNCDNAEYFYPSFSSFLFSFNIYIDEFIGMLK